MKVININQKNITYSELAAALLKLKLKNKSDLNNFVYVHEGSGAKVELAKRKEQDVVYPAYVAGIASVLEGFGIIQDSSSLVKMIEKQRLQARSPAA